MLGRSRSERPSAPAYLVTLENKIPRQKGKSHETAD